MKTTYPVPTDLRKDEEKWAIHFSLKTIIVFLIGCVITFLLGKLFELIHLMWPIIIIFGILTILVSATTMIYTMEGNYMQGGRQTLDVYILKKISRKMAACVYVKGYNQYILDQERFE